MNPRVIPIQCIVPPHMLREIIQKGDASQQTWALQTLAVSAQIRGRREILGQLPVATPAGTKRRTVYDAKHAQQAPGTLVRGEGDPASSDVAANEAYDGAGKTFDFYEQAFGRNSIDDRGMRLDSTVHYGRSYDNAFWDGQQMVYGDGDGRIFGRFTQCLDVIGHELTHGVTQFEAGLNYQDQSGALNESMSDVFGSLVKQKSLGQKAQDADWLIGKGLLAPNIQGVALRSMKDPGTAYDDPTLGKDPQPGSMTNYVDTTDDNGGVHINSGIPNRAFFLTATAMGGFAWEKAGVIWYKALSRLRPTSNFQEAADMTFNVAGEQFGTGSAEQEAVRTAWATVGLTVRQTRTQAAGGSGRG
jgi:Zn-dependent metalloprotease